MPPFLDTKDGNFSLDVLVVPSNVEGQDPVLTDVRIGIILTFLAFLAFLCVGYLCTCMAYNQFRRWKHHCAAVLETQRINTRFGPEIFYQDCEETLPSYTIVTGLPSYEQAMEHLRQLRLIRRASSPHLHYEGESLEPPRLAFARLSLGEIFQFYQKESKELPY